MRFWIPFDQHDLQSLRGSLKDLPRGLNALPKDEEHLHVLLIFVKPEVHRSRFLIITDRRGY